MTTLRLAVARDGNLWSSANAPPPLDTDVTQAFQTSHEVWWWLTRSGVVKQNGRVVPVPPIRDLVVTSRWVILVTMAGDVLHAPTEGHQPFRRLRTCHPEPVVRVNTADDYHFVLFHDDGAVTLCRSCLEQHVLFKQGFHIQHVGSNLDTVHVLDEEGRWYEGPDTASLNPQHRPPMKTFFIGDDYVVSLDVDHRLYLNHQPCLPERQWEWVQVVDTGIRGQLWGQDALTCLTWAECFS